MSTLYFQLKSTPDILRKIIRKESYAIVNLAKRLSRKLSQSIFAEYNNQTNIVCTAYIYETLVNLKYSI